MTVWAVPILDNPLLHLCDFVSVAALEKESSAYHAREMKNAIARDSYLWTVIKCNLPTEWNE